ncbi:hypothetical protein [Paraclostridium dentum]|uniref:hypothetical protein n=1 Tax=Paraclostridium dentum TaxID=2662455 RepID=UPI003F2B82AB
MKLTTDNKTNMINIIANCNDSAIKTKWIQELAHKTDIECMESECDSCLIAIECIETLGGE